MNPPNTRTLVHRSAREQHGAHKVSRIDSKLILIGAGKIFLTGRADRIRRATRRRNNLAEGSRDRETRAIPRLRPALRPGCSPESVKRCYPPTQCQSPIYTQNHNSTAKYRIKRTRCPSAIGPNTFQVPENPETKVNRPTLILCSTTA